MVTLTSKDFKEWSSHFSLMLSSEFLTAVGFMFTLLGVVLTIDEDKLKNEDD